MTNMIDRVAELKKLRDNPFVPMVQLMNAAHDDLSAMLDVMGEIRPGDADILDFIQEYLCDDPNDNADPEIDIAKKVVRRYQAIAAQMEAERK